MSRFIGNGSQFAFAVLMVVLIGAPWARGGAIYTVASVGQADPWMANQFATSPITSTRMDQAQFNSNAPGGVTIGPPPGLLYSGPVPAGFQPNVWLFAQNTSNVVGWGNETGQRSSPPNFAFASLNGQPYDLGTLPGYFGSQALGVNASGQDVVGMAYKTAGNPSIDQPFVYTVGQGMTQIATPGGNQGLAYGVNNAGLIVGEYAIAPNGMNAHAFISDSGGPAADLNHLIDPSLRWTIIRASVIDNQGDIAAIGVNASGALCSLVLAPVSGLSLQQITSAIDQQGTIDSGGPQP